MKRSLSRWDIYAYCILGVILLFQVTNWFKMPLFMDCYYHLSVMRGFDDAGGWVGRAFWENAPVGRPHLYPPLFHLLEWTLFKTGLGPITIARLCDVSIYPLLLFVVWSTVKNVYSSRLAFFGLFLLSSSYTLYLAILNNTPFSLAFIFGILAFYSFKRSKYLATLLWLVLSFYTHSLMSWLAVLALFMDTLLRAQERRHFLKIFLAAVALASPLFIHQLRFLSFVKFFRTNEFYFAELDLPVYLLALAGDFLVIKNRRSYSFFIALSASMAVLLWTNRDRFLSGQGLIPLMLLAAVAMDVVWEGLDKQGKMSLRVAFFAAAILVFHFFTPLVCFTPLKRGPNIIMTSWLRNQIGWGSAFTSSKEKTLYYPKFIQEIVRLIKQKTGQDDIIFSNYNYVGGMVAVLSHRATSDAMLPEIKPFQSFDEIGCARCILWFKSPEEQFPQILTQLIDKYNLKKVGETELAFIYENEKTPFKRRVLPARAPFGACFFLLFLAAGGIWFDLKNKS